MLEIQVLHEIGAHVDHVKFDQMIEQRLNDEIAIVSASLILGFRQQNAYCTQTNEHKLVLFGANKYGRVGFGQRRIVFASIQLGNANRQRFQRFQDVEQTLHNSLQQTLVSWLFWVQVGHQSQ